MMRVCISILIVFVLCYDKTLYANAIFVELSSNLSVNVAGLLGDNGTELECSYTAENIERVFSVSLMAFNWRSKSFETVAIYIPDDVSLLTIAGQYLKGRVTMTTISQSSLKAVMSFNQLMCIDETLYTCQVNYIDSIGTHGLISNNISISVQVLPSKPDSVLLVHTPADPSLNSAKHMEYSTFPPSGKVTPNEFETLSKLQNVKQYDTSAYNYFTIHSADYDTTTSTLSNDEFSSDISNKGTTYSVEQTLTAQGIAEGDYITVVCNGDVGKPPAKHVFEKCLNGKIVPIQHTVITTSKSDISENCSYYRTSNLTFKVTATDNNAVIRCVVNSSMAQYVYVETAPIEVYYNEAQSTTVSPVKKQSNVENTAVIVVGTVFGSILLVLVIVFGVIMNKTFRCLLMRNRNERSADYVNTTNQQNPSLYKGVGPTLDVHNYEQLTRMEHLYNNFNLSHD